MMVMVVVVSIEWARKETHDDGDGDDDNGDDDNSSDDDSGDGIDGGSLLVERYMHPLPTYLETSMPRVI